MHRDTDSLLKGIIGDSDKQSMLQQAETPAEGPKVNTFVQEDAKQVASQKSYGKNSLRSIMEEAENEDNMRMLEGKDAPSATSLLQLETEESSQSQIEANI